MKRSIKLALAAAVALSGTAAFATNGDHLIGLGAKARGMGGVNVGVSHGAESALANPALITSVEGTEVSFGGTVFMPKVSTNFGAGYADSAADLSVIPEVAIGQKASENFYWGIGMFGTAGMGTDYRDATGNTANFNMVTNLQLMQFGVPMAYKVDGFSVGVTPILQYGSLDINYKGNLDATNMSMGYPAVSGGAGVAQDLGFGYTAGVALEMSDLTLGASYKSAIDMEYKGQLTGALKAFQNFGLLTSMTSDHLEQPAEIGVGASYKMAGNTFAIDYKQIKWSDAKGYKDFGWENQNVLALGYQFAQDNWALRAGYNHAKNPIKEHSAAGAAGGNGAALNMFNLLGFPATIVTHYTVGASYGFSKTTSLDLAYVYAPEVTDTYSMAAFAGFGPMNPTSISTKHSQTSGSAQLNFKF
ncbi:MAG: outer membrane protein transport protein [Sulfuricurvum sp.]|uniref:OmpP1/FadL family transporter n=1 Tax=Sulfuricurvum sp. TaxID=2025608 RepID=UPI0025D0C5C1|nr:outer membrane protein transport protein [Sulfuricurvum sp.]MCK9373900.1 outer membrane protein transport protein [Sulfuricurvum sp.]